MEQLPTSLAEVPPYGGRSRRTRTGQGLSRISAAARWTSYTRRQFLGRAAAVGMGVGLFTLGVLPPARRARAHDGPKYVIRGLHCPSYYQNSWNACNKPCGPSCIYPQACKDGGHYKGYHRDDSGWDLRPDECAPGSTPTADGWLWRVNDTDCGDCQLGNDTVTYRCHDGIKIGASCGGRGDSSICKFKCHCGCCDPAANNDPDCGVDVLP